MHGHESDSKHIFGPGIGPSHYMSKCERYQESESYKRVSTLDIRWKPCTCTLYIIQPQNLYSVKKYSKFSQSSHLQNPSK